MKRSFSATPTSFPPCCGAGLGVGFGFGVGVGFGFGGGCCGLGVGVGLGFGCGVGVGLGFGGTVSCARARVALMVTARWVIPAATTERKSWSLFVPAALALAWPLARRPDTLARLPTSPNAT